jgi:hypothetical protein
VRLLQYAANKPGFPTATIGLDEQAGVYQGGKVDAGVVAEGYFAIHMKGFYCSGVLLSDYRVEGVPSLPHIVPLIPDEVY